MEPYGRDQVRTAAEGQNRQRPVAALHHRKISFLGGFPYLPCEEQNDRDDKSGHQPSLDERTGHLR